MSKGPVAIAKARMPAQFDLDYSWLGLSQTTERQHFKLSFAEKDHTYASDGTFIIAPVTIGTPVQKRYRFILPETQMKALLDSISKVTWVPVDKPAEKIVHTDDYPNTSLTFTMDKGETRVTLFSSSNTPNGAPWNLREDDRIFTTDDARIADEMSALLKSVRPAKPEGWVVVPASLTPAPKRK